MNISCGNLPFRLHSNLLSAVKFKLVFSGCTVDVLAAKHSSEGLEVQRGLPASGWKNWCSSFWRNKKRISHVCVCVFVCQSNILIYSLIHTSLCPRGVGLVGSKKPRGDISNEGQTWHIFPQEVILWLSLSRHCCFQSCRHIAPQVKFQSNWLSKACYVFFAIPIQGRIHAVYRSSV